MRDSCGGNSHEGVWMWHGYDGGVDHQIAKDGAVGREIDRHGGAYGETS